MDTTRHTLLKEDMYELLTNRKRGSESSSYDVTNGLNYDVIIVCVFFLKSKFSNELEFIIGKKSKEKNP